MSASYQANTDIYLLGNSSSGDIPHISLIEAIFHIEQL